MRQFFYKSGLLCLVISMVSFLALFSLTSYSNSSSMKKIMPFLSDEYAVVNNNGFSVAGFYEVTKSLADDYSVGVCLPDGYSRAMYLGNSAKESIKISEGRFFAEEEVSRGDNVVLLSEKQKNLCREEEGEYYFAFRGKRFKAVGFFETSDEGTVSASRIFNMTAEALNEYSDWQYGFFDCGESSVETLKKAEAIGSDTQIYKYGTKEADVFNNVLSNIEFMLLLFFVVLFLVVINIFSALNTWIDGKRKELAIRKLSGATARDVSKNMCADYYIISSIAFLIGLCIFYIFMVTLKSLAFSESLLQMLGNKVFFKDVAIAFIGVTLIGCAVLPGYIRREIKSDILPSIKGRYYLND